MGEAYPGKAIPALDSAVAALSISRVDTKQQTVTVTVHILCPEALGGRSCELSAVAASQALAEAGAECIQDGCEYDGVSRLFSVKIRGAFFTGERSEEPKLKLAVYADSVRRPYAVSFLAEQTLENTPQFAMGEDGPVGVIPGGWKWSIRLEEHIPPETEEVGQPDAPFILTVNTEMGNDTYLGCSWTSIRRELRSDGIHRIQTGFATGKEQ